MGIPMGDELDTGLPGFGSMSGRRIAMSVELAVQAANMRARCLVELVRCHPKCDDPLRVLLDARLRLGEFLNGLGVRPRFSLGIEQAETAVDQTATSLTRQVRESADDDTERTNLVQAFEQRSG